MDNTNFYRSDWVSPHFVLTVTWQIISRNSFQRFCLIARLFFGGPVTPTSYLNQIRLIPLFVLPTVIS